MLQLKMHHAGQQRRQSIQENSQRKTKEHVEITGSQAEGTPGNATCDHLIALK